MIRYNIEMVLSLNVHHNMFTQLPSVYMCQSVLCVLYIALYIAWYIEQAVGAGWRGMLGGTSVKIDDLCTPPTVCT